MKSVRNSLRNAVSSLIVAACFSACSAPNQKVASPTSNPSQVAASGAVSLVRPLPAESSSAPVRMLGFAPAMGIRDGLWLEFNREERRLKLMQGEERLLSAEIEGDAEIRNGTYRLLHKQTKPAWYAPDSYFIARKLPVPPKTDSRRFLKGAFGDFVIVFDGDLTLHNAPLWAKDVKGLRLADNDLAKLFYSLEGDSLVEVR